MNKPVNILELAAERLWHAKEMLRWLQACQSSPATEASCLYASRELRNAEEDVGKVMAVMADIERRRAR